MTHITSARDRLILAILAVFAAVLLWTLVPLQMIQAMGAVLKGAEGKIAATGNALFKPALDLVTFFFPFWTGLCIIAGAALFVIAWPIYRGERWARPAAVGLLAIPSITGAYLTGPIMSFSPESRTIFMVIMAVGLIPYFAVLLWEKSTWKEKAANLLLFLLLGVTAAWTFANGHSTLRMLLARPQPYAFNSSMYGYILGLPVVWAGVLATVVSLPLLAYPSRAGWFLSTIGVVIMLAGTVVLYLTHQTTVEFMQGIAMAAGCLILLLIPGIGGRLARGPSAG